ncbi:MAG: hypothetical protein Q7J78_05005, partial [Clostridiales bacterium]|nr:hypothetical protein [Clostridiales bacterium]
PIEDTAPLFKYTNHVHLRNASSGKMQDTYENGVIDFKWVVTALKDINYKGALAIEYFNGFDSDMSNTVSLRNCLLELGIKEYSIDIINNNLSSLYVKHTIKRRGDLL